MKTCSGCGEPKPLAEFNKDRIRPDALNPRCRLCQAAAGAARYAQDRARIIAQREEYRRAHPEKMRARSAANYLKYREQHGALTRRWHRENADKVRARNVRTRRERPEMGRARSAAYRARKVGAPGRGITAGEWKELLEQSMGLCMYCGAHAELTGDHIESLARGGAHEPENVALCCRACNGSKADTPLLVWLARRRAA